MDSKWDSKKNYVKFFELSDPFNSKALRLTVRGYSDWITKDYAYLLFRGIKNSKDAISLGAYMGGKEANFIWTDLVLMNVISSTTRALLVQDNITGWKTYPVEVFDRKGIPLPGYHGFSVIGKECRRDRSRSQILTRQAVPGGKPFEVYKGLYFFEEDWDGSDIFLVKNNIVVITERVRNLFKKNKVTNVEMVPLADVEIDVYLDKFEKDI